MTVSTRVDNNRLILGTCGFDPRMGRHQGIALANRVEELFGLAVKVKINGKNFLLNKNSLAEWLARTALKNSATDDQRDHLADVFRGVISNPKIDLGTLITNHTLADRKIKVQDHSLYNSNFLLEFLTKQASLTRNTDSYLYK